MKNDNREPSIKPEKSLPPHQAAVQRNPWLQEHWFTRLLAPVVVGGATMTANDYKLSIWCFWGGLLVVAVFSGNALLEDYSPRDAVGVVILCTVMIAAMPIIIAARLGYRKRDHIDVEGVPHMVLTKRLRIVSPLLAAAPALIKWLTGLFK